MNYNKKLLVFFFFIYSTFSFYGCVYNTNSRDRNSKNDTDTIALTDTLDCLHIVAHIVWESSFFSEDRNKDVNINKTVIYIDSITNGIIEIRIAYKDTPKDKGGSNRSEFPVGWLELDMNKGELKDVTIDPDNPVRLKFNTTLLPLIKRQCLH